MVTPVHKESSLRFYRNVDRENAYGAHCRTESHPMFGDVVAFVTRYGLNEKRLLEIGSGMGLFQDIVRDYTGIDVSEHLGRHYHKPYFVTESARLPFADNSFDAVIASATHEHIPELELSLEEMTRVLRPGGVCLFAPAWYTRPWFASGLALRDWGELTVREKLEKATIPIRDALLVRGTTALLKRSLALLRWSATSRPIPLVYRRLKANYETFWQSDSDACNSLDPFFLLLWFRSRGFVCHSHPSIIRAVLVRGDALILEKTLSASPQRSASVAT